MKIANKVKSELQAYLSDGEIKCYEGKILNKYIIDRYKEN
jgi:hypothetical protein